MNASVAQVSGKKSELSISAKGLRAAVLMIVFGLVSNVALAATNAATSSHIVVNSPVSQIVIKIAIGLGLSVISAAPFVNEWRIYRRNRVKANNEQ